MDPIAEKITRLLTDLGDSPETIAAALEGQGITGLLQDSKACPLAVYLNAQFGHTYTFDIDSDEVAYWPVDASKGFTSLGMPHPASRFVEKFDTMDFPRLIQPEQKES